MAAGLLICEMIFTFCLSAGILYRYGNWKRQNVLVTMAVLIAWYFSFLIIFVLPLDVSSTVYRQCLQEEMDRGVNISSNETNCLEPWSYVGDNVFPNLWRIVYWSCQFLTWLVLPLMQSYAKAGEFSIRGKLKSALVDNAIYYGSYLFICGILLIYIAFKPGLELDWQKVKAIASSASNTWGLLLLVGLLGYALVEIPRSLWLSVRPGHNLHRAYFTVAKIALDKSDAENSLEDLLDSIQVLVSCIKPHDPLYRELEVVMNKIPLQLHRKTKPNPHAEIPQVTPTLKSLVTIHKQLIKALHTCRRTETQYRLAVEKAILLEDVERNRNSRDHTFKHTFTTKTFITPAMEWWWRCRVQSRVLGIIAVLCAVLSFAVVWSEVTFFNKQPVLSIFAVLLNLARSSYDYSTIEMISTLIISYLCYCAYSTVLKIRVLNYYYLAPYHQTDEHSLIFSGMMICRLTPPMCLNFLGLIHMDSHVIKSHVMETYYTQVMGHMDVISIISDGFNIYFPMTVLAFCLATYFSLGSRFLSFLGFQQFLDDDELTTEMVDDGRELVGREKRRKQRMEDSSNRRRDYVMRFGSGASTTRPEPEADREMQTAKRTEFDGGRSSLLDGAQPISVDEPVTNQRLQHPPRGLFDDDTW